MDTDVLMPMDDMETERTPQDFGLVTQRFDGSFVIELDRMPYHVPVGEAMYDEVLEYVTGHPDMVEVEPEPVPPTLEEVKVAKRKDIAKARWEAETKGVTLNDMTIDTGRESQGLITGAALQANMDPTYTCRWKTSTGFVELNAEMILAVATAVRQHVQACFDREAEKLAEIDAAQTPEAVEAITWEGGDS